MADAEDTSVVAGGKLSAEGHGLDTDCPPDDMLLTREQLGERFNLTSCQVRRWTRKIPHVIRRGRRLLYRLADLVIQGENGLEPNPALLRRRATPTEKRGSRLWCLPGEVWRPVVGYEDLYEVSDLGRVRSLVTHMVLRTWSDGNLHLQVALYKNKKMIMHKAHRLVLEAFVSPRPSGMESLHGDGDGTNNRLYNLRWGTHQENMDDRKRHGRLAEGQKNHNAKLTDESVQILRRYGDMLTEREWAKIFGVHHVTIHRAKKGAIWKGVIVAILMFLPTGADGHDWYEGLRSNSGGSCCGGTDCEAVPSRFDPSTGRRQVYANGGWWDVPPEKLLGVIAPDGRTHACFGRKVRPGTKPHFYCVISGEGAA